MTLTISTGSSRFSVKLPEDECRRKFSELVIPLISDYPAEAVSMKNTEIGERDIDLHTPDTCDLALQEETVRAEAASGDWDNTYSVADEQPPEACRGFLYVECSHCGNAWGFNAKDDRTSAICRECGKETTFTNMVKVYANCQCGRRFKYQTNHTSELFDIYCLDCGSPIPLGYNKKKGAYETL